MVLAAAADGERPKLSVVVAPVRGGEALPGCLDALARQEAAPLLEILVPVDGSIDGLAALRSAHPAVRFLPVEGTEALAASPDLGVAHQAIDRRRAAAIAAARGELVALTEEYARPAPDWCARIVEAHRERHAVIGGAIENANPGYVNWAVYFCDAGRYQNPIPEGEARYVSDVNVSYKREALEAVADEWRETYHETGLHDALRARGESLRLRRDLVVHQDRGRLSLGYALRERFAWARIYAGRRSREVDPRTRLLLALGAPLLGGLLLVRQARVRLERRSGLGPFLRVLPLLALMDLVWGLGECAGYLSGRATARR